MIEELKKDIEQKNSTIQAL